MQGWSYAEMSARARAAGGPDQYEKSLISQGAKSIYTWLGLAVVGVVVLGIDKLRTIIKEHNRKRKEMHRDEPLEIKREFLAKIRDKKCKIKNIVIVT